MNLTRQQLERVLDGFLKQREARVVKVILDASFGLRRTVTERLTVREIARRARIAENHVSTTLTALKSEKDEKRRVIEEKERGCFAIHLQWVYNHLGQLISAPLEPLEQGILLRVLEDLSDGYREALLASEDFASGWTGDVKKSASFMKTEETSSGHICRSGAERSPGPGDSSQVSGSLAKAGEPAGTRTDTPTSENSSPPQSGTEITRSGSNEKSPNLGDSFSSNVDGGSESFSRGDDHTPTIPSNEISPPKQSPNLGDSFEAIEPGVSCANTEKSPNLGDSACTARGTHLSSHSPALTVSELKAFSKLLVQEPAYVHPECESARARQLWEAAWLAKVRALVGDRTMEEHGGWYRNRLRENPGKFERVFNAVALDVREGRTIRNRGGHFAFLWKQFYA
jgi:hypothetical protein